MKKRVVSLVLVTVVGIIALIGGLVAAMGFDDALALVTGGDEPAAIEVTKAEGNPTDEVEITHSSADGEASIIVTPFKEIIVNIHATTATGRQTTRFLKLNTALVYDENRPGASYIEERKVFVRESFQDYLRQLSERDVQGSAGLATLKAELLRRARSVADSDAPREILISDLIVQ
ncbi:flagellar basal body-associated protein FliL [Pseudooceanicola sp. MF1-13]|uniref:flagellar basal body-associated FliL family protein n=1 Tax=Pseudooceanicola sp. MF1-13 TaxID=3379095 RepID=UPI003892A806